MKERNKGILKLLLKIILIFILVNIFFAIRFFKPYCLQRDIINEYYDQGILKEILQEELGADYSDNLEEDFYLFVTKLFESFYGGAL